MLCVTKFDIAIKQPQSISATNELNNLKVSTVIAQSIYPH